MCHSIKNDSSIPIPEYGWKVFKVNKDGHLKAVYFDRGMTYKSSRWNYHVSPIKRDLGIYFFLSRNVAEDWRTLGRAHLNTTIRKVRVRGVVAVGTAYRHTVGAAKEVYIYSENKSKEETQNDLS